MIRHLFRQNLLILFFFVFTATTVVAENKTHIVKVGVFQLAPLVQIDNNGSPQGIFVDIINAICDAEGWKVEYIKVTWNEGLERVKNGEIDLMTAVMHLSKRESFLDFPKESTFNIWGQIYTHKNANISGLFDMEGKTVGILKGGANGENFIELLSKFEIQGKIIAFDSQEDVAQAIKERRVDAGVFTNIHGYNYQQSHKLKQTQMVFNPSYLKYATAEGTNQQLLSTIDIYLSKWKSNQNSPYYKIIEKHLSSYQKSKLPGWVQPVVILTISLMGIITIGAFFLMFFNKKLKNEIKAGTQNLVTELNRREKAEVTLKKNEDRLSVIVNSMSDWVWDVDVDGRYTYCSEKVQNILGYYSDEIIGKTCFDFMAPDESEKIGKAFNKIAAQKKPIKDLENWNISKNGRNVCLLTNGVPIIDENGKLLGFSGVDKDITNRKQAEAVMERYQNLLDTTGRLAQIGGWEFDVKTSELTWTKEVYRIHEVKDGYILTVDNAIDFYTSENKAQIQNAMNNTMEHGEPFDLELQIQTAKGNLRWVHSIGYANTIDGIVTTISGTIQDISERKQTQIANKKLESRLQQSQKMESIGTLAGGIAHDFNNILFPILGYSEMLLNDVPEDSPFQDGLEQIHTGALRAKDLVQQILTFSRQESNNFKLMKMQPVIKEALKFIRSTIPRSIEIKQDIQTDCGVIKADPTQIYQIIMNLTTNAYHAMEDTGGELKVSLQEIELGEYDVINPDMKPGNYACLKIADNGVGMDKDLTKKIFDPYFTTKPRGKGTGMGLSVAHGIINSMGGAIQVYSKPGHGTEFKIYIAVETSSSGERKTQGKQSIQGGTEQILLVDDEEAIITMEKQILERLGYSVTSRSSSIEALEAFRADPGKFDLVITDMAMPKLPGDKFAVELIKIRPNIPILLCTGFSENIPLEKATSLGIKDFLMKPFAMKDLAQKIREVLYQSEM